MRLPTPFLALTALLAAAPAWAQASASALAAPAPGPSAPPQAPPVRIAQVTAPLTIRDSRHHSVTLRIPFALYRGANAFRLYGNRPLTLRDYDRRRDLYRDAFLELATRSRLRPAGGPDWTPLQQQLDRLRGGAATGGGPAGPSPDTVAGAASAATALVRKLVSLPGYEHVSALARALGVGAAPLEAAQPVAAALQLRALATDEAAQRLILLGRELKVEGPDADPAMRDGFRAARGDFDQVRTGVWPAVAGALRKDGAQITAATFKDLVLSRLGAWAIFGYAGWQSAEAALNAEYRGQYAVCLATLDYGLDTAARSDPGAAPLAVYGEFALSYQLTETLKDGQIGGLMPAGGRSNGSWQVELSARCNELRKWLEAPAPALAAGPTGS